MAQRDPLREMHDTRLPCLTEMSVVALAAGAIALSGLLWFFILAVL
ncbi:hypothetical protein K1718_24165 [Roseibium porphyridii]|uniref:Uncharacterized protein n=1 Tax=Roseibium porphyridii TaxID=2866279 RepID=A0ABY8F163_9HYPH|nr:MULTISPECIES: hypothetical protein [Stappiaceae]QFT34206.1 hypothetical protein FIV00_27165 [Labrenzia sp. THAF82]WFE89216.1 hypothetical protein K1718_24165 [Roseibium sp. KMA01]